MKDVYILGIESSCDETSASIVKNGCEEIATVVLSQIDIHKDFGGVVPEIASRHHVKNITMVIEECFEKADCNKSLGFISRVKDDFSIELIASYNLFRISMSLNTPYSPLVPLGKETKLFHVDELYDPIFTTVPAAILISLSSLLFTQSKKTSLNVLLNKELKL